MNEINRKIYFFQVEWVKNNGKRIQAGIGLINSILRLFSGSVVDIENGRLFIQEYRNSNLFSANRSLWRVEKIRKEDLPLKFDESKLKEEPLGLKDHEGLAEPSHFVVFDGKIIGAEYNHYGVRWVNSTLMRVINEYLDENPHPQISRVEIRPIFRKDLYNLLDKYVEIRGIKIKIATNYAKLLSKEDPESFGKMFSAAELIDGVWLTLNFAIYGKKTIEKKAFDNIINSIKKLIRRPDSLENLKIAEIKGRLEGSDSIETVNLLEEMLVSEKRVAKLERKSRAVDPDSMFREILDSFSNYERELKEYMGKSEYIGEIKGEDYD